PGGDVYAYLAAEALADAPEPVRELLRRLSPFDRISEELCSALGVPDAEEAMAALLKRGLVAELPDGGQMIHALVREFARIAWPLEPDEARDVHRSAAVWLAGRGRVEEALRALAATDDHEAHAGLLAEQGPALLSSGAAAVVIRHAQLLPD